AEADRVPGSTVAPGSPTAIVSVPDVADTVPLFWNASPWKVDIPVPESLSTVPPASLTNLSTPMPPQSNKLYPSCGMWKEPPEPFSNVEPLLAQPYPVLPHTTLP